MIFLTLGAVIALSMSAACLGLVLWHFWTAPRTKDPFQ